MLWNWLFNPSTLQQLFNTHTYVNLQLKTVGLFKYVWQSSGHQALKVTFECEIEIPKSVTSP